MSLKDQLAGEIFTALKNRQETRLRTLRLLSSSLHNEEIAKQRSLSLDEEISIVRREIKRREEAIEAYKRAGRQDRAADEKEELDILAQFLPKQASRQEIEAVVDKIIARNFSSNLTRGQLIGMVMKELGGKADGKTVAELVEEKLSSLSSKGK